MPSSMLLMTVSSRSRSLRTSPTRPVTESAIVLNSRASHEMVSEPSAGTRWARSPPAIRRAVVSKRCRRRSTNTRTTSAMRSDQQQRERPGAGDHASAGRGSFGADAAGVQVEDQDAVDAVRGVVAAVAGLAVAKRDHRAQDRPAAGFDHPARGPRCSGGRRWQAWQVGERRSKLARVADRARSSSGRRRCGRAASPRRRAARFAEALDHLRDQAAVVLDHLVLERRADRARPGRGRSRCSPSSSVRKWWVE